jgi:predicted  nucleic acid-binding Zn-ribbon protein
MKYERAKDVRFEKRTELDDMLQHIKASEREVSELDKTVEKLRSEIDELTSDLKIKQQDFENWKFTIKNEMAELESSENNTDSDDVDNVNNNFTNW